MATLQKFKLLATHCAVSGSPTRSPSASPVCHLRRRVTLRKLLSRRRDEHRIPPSNPPQKRNNSNNASSSVAAVSLKLKDLLLLSSPPPTPRKAEERVMRPEVPPRGGSRGRQLTATLRQRLMRRSWRPVLVSIPE